MKSLVESIQESLLTESSESLAKKFVKKYVNDFPNWDLEKDEISFLEKAFTDLYNQFGSNIKFTASEPMNDIKSIAIMMKDAKQTTYQYSEKDESWYEN